MANQITGVGSEYSPACGLIFLFNLIVGTGVLAMPLAFYQAGWLVSIVVIIILALLSYICASFVVEAMAAANMKLRVSHKHVTSSKNDVPSEVDESSVPLLDTADPDIDDVYSITERVEMGTMASMFYNKYGMIAFYLSIIIYLYGDMSIYCVVISKSLRNVICTYKTDNITDEDPCWPEAAVSRMNAYRLMLAAMTVTLCPFIFTNIQKSKYLQGVTSAMRWLGFILMITLAAIRIADGNGTGHPPIVDIKQIPTLFGVCVYAFMCHHSLPSIITPFKNKSRLNVLIAIDYISICMFYALLSFTAIFASDKLADLYTLNFLPTTTNSTSGEVPFTNIVVFQYFLALFPVVAVSSTFPIIGITLRNNLKVLFSNEYRPYPWIVDRVVFPIATIIPPLAISMATTNIEFLVGITGSYAGAAIQYVIPATLVYLSRRESARVIGGDVKNKHRSPFHGSFWVWLIIGWSGVCMILVTVHHIMTGQ